jgi:hypothetical protein
MVSGASGARLRDSDLVADDRSEQLERRRCGDLPQADIDV